MLTSGSVLAKPADVPILDTHIHLFDPTRPEGIPWPPKENKTLYKPALPERYRKVTQGLGITGAIEVECSPLPQDNDWVLGVMSKDPIMVGTIGNLEPGTAMFRKQLDRLHQNPMFLGLRYGNLWGRDFDAAVRRQEFLADMKYFASAGLVMDTANPTPQGLRNVLTLTDAVPELKVVIDHLPQMNPPADSALKGTYEQAMKEFPARRKIYVKISEVLRRVDDRVPAELAFYRERLDHIWSTFGEDRVLYGSDWPNSDTWAEYPQVLGIVREYVAGKGEAAMNKYFWKNSIAAYRWVPRNAAQQALKKQAG